MREYVAYRVPWAAINNVVVTEDEVVRCKRCIYGYDCPTRSWLTDGDDGFCSNGRRLDDSE